MIGNLIGVLFDGIAYGSLLFVISIGLSVTMGLMNFVNLAHGAFAMLGGYACVVLMTRAGVPFLATLPVAFLGPGRRRHRARAHALPAALQGAHLDQVMFSIGLVFMSVAAATWFFGPSQQPVRLPDFLRGQVRVLGLDLGAYRIFLIGVVVAHHGRAAPAAREDALRRAGARVGRQCGRRPPASASTSTACSA